MCFMIWIDVFRGVVGTLHGRMFNTEVYCLRPTGQFAVRLLQKKCYSYKE